MLFCLDHLFCRITAVADWGLYEFLDEYYSKGLRASEGTNQGWVKKSLMSKNTNQKDFPTSWSFDDNCFVIFCRISLWSKSGYLLHHWLIGVNQRQQPWGWFLWQLGFAAAVHGQLGWCFACWAHKGSSWSCGIFVASWIGLCLKLLQWRSVHKKCLVWRALSGKSYQHTRRTENGAGKMFRPITWRQKWCSKPGNSSHWRNALPSQQTAAFNSRGRETEARKEPLSWQ